MATNLPKAEDKAPAIEPKKTNDYPPYPGRDEAKQGVTYRLESGTLITHGGNRG